MEFISNNNSEVTKHTWEDIQTTKVLRVIIQDD
jgi:hypothetical protein